MATTTNEKTFSTYNEKQSKDYAKARLGYHPNVYKAILDYHTSNGGELNTVLDVGCGPGLATQGLASYFENVIGIDPSPGMIATAQSLSLTSSTSKPVWFDISTAENLGIELSPAIQDSSVDLITAANAAHWFDMPAFWTRAAKILKPSGTVAIWTSGDIRVHTSTLSASKVQAAIDDFDERHVRPHYLQGNLLVRDGYRSLPLPWSQKNPVAEFDEESFVRREWGVDEDFFIGIPEGNMDVFELTMGSQSAYVRWKEANPDVAGTADDVLKVLRHEIEQILRDAGAESGKERVKGAVRGILILIKKRA